MGLKQDLIKLASVRPELRPEIVALFKKASGAVSLNDDTMQELKLHIEALVPAFKRMFDEEYAEIWQEQEPFRSEPKFYGDWLTNTGLHLVRAQASSAYLRHIAKMLPEIYKGLHSSWRPEDTYRSGAQYPQWVAKITGHHDFPQKWKAFQNFLHSLA